MTLPPVVRVFFAMDLPATLKHALAQYIGVLKKHSKTRVIRWSLPENLHITLQFLADVNTADLAHLLTHVRTALQTESTPLTFELGRLQIFPDPYRPRVIVMDVSPQTALTRLSQEIGRGILQAGYSIEERPYRAHLTLGRIKQPKGLSLGFLNEVEPPIFGPIIIKEVTLFRSEPQPDGSRYTPLATVVPGVKMDECGQNRDNLTPN